MKFRQHLENKKKLEEYRKNLDETLDGFRRKLRGDGGDRF
jgi:hypothetical protein